MFILVFILMAVVLTAFGSTKQSRRVHRLCKIFHAMQKKCIEMRVIMKDDKKIDESLLGNEKIEEAIKLLQGECTQEMLAHTLTVIRRRMPENGQFIVAVEPPTGDGQIRVQAIKTADGKAWWAAFTSFEEELKGGGSVKSTFLANIDKLFASALTVPEIAGVIINPWNRTIQLDKNLIQIIEGAKR